LDEVAMVLVRNRPENAQWIARLGVDCNTVQFAPPASRSAADLFPFYSNVASVLYLLGRDEEAWEALKRAGRIFAGDPNLYLVRGKLLEAGGRLAEAVAQYETSLRVKETDGAWYVLGQAYFSQARYPEAADALRRAADLSPNPYDRYRVLGETYLVMGRPREALRAFRDAERFSPYRGETEALGAAFRAQLAAGRARALQMLRAEQ